MYARSTVRRDILLDKCNRLSTASVQAYYIIITNDAIDLRKTYCSSISFTMSESPGKRSSRKRDRAGDEEDHRERKHKKKHRRRKDEDNEDKRKKHKQSSHKTEPIRVKVVDEDEDENEIWIEKNIDMDGETVCRKRNILIEFKSR